MIEDLQEENTRIKEDLPALEEEVEGLMAKLEAGHICVCNRVAYGSFFKLLLIKTHHICIFPYKIKNMGLLRKK